MKKVSLLLFVIGLLGIISFTCIIPFVEETNIRAEYNKYYEQAKKDIKCSKNETQAVCYNVSEDIDTTTKESIVRYSFFTNNYHYADADYYDKDIEYIKDNIYDCTLYEFYCTVSPNHFSNYEVLVIGNGTTNYNDKSFDFDKTVERCIEMFTESIIEERIEGYSYYYKIMVIVSALVSIGSLITFLNLNFIKD